MPSIKDKFEDLNDPEAKRREVIRIAKLELAKHLKRAEDELTYLILATPTGDERNLLSEINIHVMTAKSAVDLLL